MTYHPNDLRDRRAHQRSEGEEVADTTVTEAANDLINPWTDVVETGGAKRYAPVEHEPLLVTLRAAIRSSTGGTTSGASDDATRNLLNMEAFGLWERITADVRTLTRRHLRDRPNPLLGYAVRTLTERLDALHNTNQITSTDYEHAIRRARQWREQIWSLLHKPKEMELTAPCPALLPDGTVCGVEKIINDDGDLSTALIAYYQDGTDPVARCRACGTTWEGDAPLMLLGEQIGADADKETLTELGKM